MMKKYATVVVGGTFDTIHAGHEAILTKAFESGDHVLIALTSDRYVQKYKVHSSQFTVHSFKTRKIQLVKWLYSRNSGLQPEFLSIYPSNPLLRPFLAANRSKMGIEKKGWKRQYAIVPIDTPYEPAVPTSVHTFRPVDPALIDAIVVSEKTKDRASEINALRAQAGLKLLAVIVVPMVKAEDGVSISSSRIRNGDIDTGGNLVMPESLRGALQKPLGPVFSGTILDRLLRQFQDSGNPLDSRNRMLNRMLITVGDITTKTFLDALIVPNLAIIDRRVERKPYEDAYNRLKPSTPRIEVASGPGFISQEAVKAIQRALQLKQHQAIIVDGEEDLLVLPAILHATAGSIVYYGQPQKGIVEVRVTGLIKGKVRRLLAKFR